MFKKWRLKPPAVFAHCGMPDQITNWETYNDPKIYYQSFAVVCRVSGRCKQMQAFDSALPHIVELTLVLKCRVHLLKPVKSKNRTQCGKFNLLVRQIATLRDDNQIGPINLHFLGF